MAKPILLIRIDTSRLNDNEVIKINNTIRQETNNTYHVIFINEPTQQIKIECVNDCKGLTDIDIENLINQLKQNG